MIGPFWSIHEQILARLDWVTVCAGEWIDLPGGGGGVTCVGFMWVVSMGRWRGQEGTKLERKRRERRRRKRSGHPYLYWTPVWLLFDSVYVDVHSILVMIGIHFFVVIYYITVCIMLIFASYCESFIYLFIYLFMYLFIYLFVCLFHFSLSMFFSVQGNVKYN